jgi:hypothetical protein
LDQFICPISKDYTIGGNRISKVYNALEIRLTKCEGEFYCKDEDEINDVINKINFVVAPTSFLFDVNNYDDPLVVSVENDFQWNLLQGFQLNKILKLKVNEAEDYNSIYYPDFMTSHNYYSVDTVVDRPRAEEDGIVLKVVLELDYRYQFTERKVYNFYDMLGQVGGVMGLFISIGAVFANIVAPTIYKMVLLSSLYKIERDDHGDTEQVYQTSTHQVQSEEFKNNEFEDNNIQNVAMIERGNIHQQI